MTRGRSSQASVLIEDLSTESCKIEAAMDADPTKKMPVQLTVEEESAREKAMDFYRYVGKTDVEATRLAWADLQKTFPRLRPYDSPTEVPK